MSVLVAVETLLLVLLTLLVVGLLRSHAEILRRLGDLTGDRAPHLPTSTVPHPDRAVSSEAIDVSGPTPYGEAVTIAVAPARQPTLLAFLSSGCTSCEPVWAGLHADASARLPVSARLVVVTKDENEESPARLRELAPADVTVVMTSTAWEDYRVAGSPYFILVEPDGAVAGEGSAAGWDQLVSLARDAVGDAAPGPMATASRGSGGHSDRGIARLARADAELDAAGIGPGHPSLYAAEGDGAGSEKSSA
jgi:hypothetical protein